MLKLLVDGVRSSLYELDKSCFTHDYSDSDSTTVANVMTKGVLGGSVAAFGTDSYTAVAADGTNRPIGLFLNDAAGAPFDNNHALASGKLAILRQMASCEVDVYETKADDADITYEIGDKLYASASGLLTNVAGTDTTVIGVVTKVPTPASPFLGLDMAI